MGFRDHFKKKDDEPAEAAESSSSPQTLAPPQFTLIRSDTSTQEQVWPPPAPPPAAPKEPDTFDQFLSAKEPNKARRSLDVFRSGRSRSASASSQSSYGGGGLKDSNNNNKETRRLSHRLHLNRHTVESSESVPANLPDIEATDPTDKEGAESQWEKRATMLASQNDMARSRPSSPPGGPGSTRPTGRPRSASAGPVSSKTIDEDIQEAIRLHEEGNFERSTRIFGRLADPKGANNPLSQVLYGLALRHGWGCAPDPTNAVKYLSAAASNSASIEELALKAGMKKGGVAKGELVLAIFELANCFRHGWGIPKDAYAAKQYYETAANLGDADAMNETAWCYLEGFGCKKDKYKSAQYYRLAEKAGNKTLGNSWIWKEKYGPAEAQSGRK